MLIPAGDRILQKHIKRQIISLSGGFQVIADLNAYHAFIASLKVRSPFNLAAQLLRALSFHVNIFASPAFYLRLIIASSTYFPHAAGVMSERPSILHCILVEG